METITITLGDVAENHVGMERIGQLAAGGLSTDKLKDVQEKLQHEGFVTEYYDLGTLLMEDSADAGILVIRGGLSGNEREMLWRELSPLNWDTKARMYGRVVNKKARYNLCFDHKDQEPDYANGKGRIVSWSHIPTLTDVKDRLEDTFDLKGVLRAEGNRYYNDKCYIGWHGDSERRIVIAMRLGKTMPIRYRWYRDGKPISDVITIMLNDGDIYAMSEKAVGFDWKKKKIPTLRHSASYQ